MHFDGNDFLLITGYRFEKVCESCHMTLNKNAVYGDSGMFPPGGVRIGECCSKCSMFVCLVAKDEYRLRYVFALSSSVI